MVAAAMLSLSPAARSPPLLRVNAAHHAFNARRGAGDEAQVEWMARTTVYAYREWLTPT
jgi:hypothetical protein